METFKYCNLYTKFLHSLNLIVQEAVKFSTDIMQNKTETNLDINKIEYKLGDANIKFEPSKLF